MKWISWVLGLGLALMLGSALADTPRITPIYLTDVEADLGIDADGTVSSVNLPRTPALEGEIGDRLEERMRGWRFEVDAASNGEKPSRIHVRMMLEARDIEGNLEIPGFSTLMLK